MPNKEMTKAEVRAWLSLANAARRFCEAEQRAARDVIKKAQQKLAKANRS